VIGTANYRALTRQVTRRNRVALITISVNDPDNVDFRFATQLCGTPGGAVWEPMVSEGTISNGTKMLDPSVPLGTASFVIADRPSSQFPDTKFSTVLAQYQFIGAPVTIFFWNILPAAEEGLGVAHVASYPADALRRFKGVIQSYRVDLGGIEFQCIVDRVFNKPVTVRTATQTEFPRLPQDAFGAALPIVYGAVGGMPYRNRTASVDGFGGATTPGRFGTIQHIRELLSGVGRAGPAILVDPGRDGGSNPNARIMVTGHAVKQFGSNNPYGTTAWLQSSFGSAHCVDPANANIFNLPTGAGFQLTDGTPPVISCPVVPVGVETTADSGQNVGALLVANNEGAFATINAAKGHRRVRVKLPDIPPLGDFVQAILYVVYRAFGTTVPFTATIINGASTSSMGSLANSATDTWASLNLGGPGSGSLPADGWSLGGVRLEVAFTGGSPTGVIEVVALGIAIQYLPAQSLVETRRQYMKLRTYGRSALGATESGIGPFKARHNLFYIWKDVVTDLYEFTGKLFANVFGWADDASGTVTGVANALVERASDIVRHVLLTYGAGTVLTTAGAMGSFIDARRFLRTYTTSPMVLGFASTATQSVQSLIEQVAQSGPALVYPSEFDGIWRFRPWQTYPASGEVRGLTGATFFKTLTVSSVCNVSGSGALTITRPSGDFVADGVKNGMLIVTSCFPNGTKVTNVIAGTVTVDTPATSGLISGGVLFQSVQMSFPGASAAVKDIIASLAVPGPVLSDGGGIFPDGTAIVAVDVPNLTLTLAAAGGTTGSTNASVAVTIPTATYTIPVSRGDLLDPTTGPRVEPSSEASVASGITLPYAYDAVSNGYTQSAEVSSSGSKAGFDRFNLRDQNMKVDGFTFNANGGSANTGTPLICNFSAADPTTKTFLAGLVGGELVIDGGGVFPNQIAVASYNPSTFVMTLNTGCFATSSSVTLKISTTTNGVIDFVSDGGERHAAIQSGDWDPLNLVAAVESAMAAADVPKLYQANYGGLIIAGVSDKLDWLDVGTVRAATLPAGTYTMEQLAALVQKTMNAVSVNTVFTVTHDRATRKFTVKGSAGGFIKFATGANRSTTAWTTLGFTSAQGDPATPSGGVVGALEVEEQLIAIHRLDGPLELHFFSGGFGVSLRNRSAYEVLGFLPADLVVRSAEAAWVGVSPKGNRERKLRDLDATYFKKPSENFDGRCIYDSGTALEVRNRIIDLKARPRGTVTFVSPILEDMEVGDTFLFSNDMDALTGYPVHGGAAPEGSWASRTFFALESHVSFGQSWQTEIIAIDVND
jgi:hypothetical protein